MRPLALLGALLLAFTVWAKPYDTVSGALAAEKGCLSCHEGIEKFSDGPMMDAIAAIGAAHGDPGGCVVCHGGTPAATTKEQAHRGAPRELTQANGPDMLDRKSTRLNSSHRQ